MKLFQKLILAPAALGLLAPVAANAADLNLDGVNKYAAEEQVTSVSQFSDVRPTDWAYQALSNLVERYGCVAGYPNGTYKGGQAMTRYEAAALLNACLDRVTEVTDELKRLMKEFEKELAVLKGRVDGLEAKVGELEANQFSTTTKLKGIATMVLGGVGGDTTAFTSQGTTGAITFNYDLKLNFDTSFTGKDLLRTQLRSGNANAYSAFQPAISPNTGLEVFTDQCTGLEQGGGCSDNVAIGRLFYQFPIGESFTGTVGAKVRQDDMLAMWPSAYPADSILDIFTYAGARGAYSLNLGAGFGLSYLKNGWGVSVNYVSYGGGIITGGLGNPGAAPSSDNGIGSDYTATAQIGYAGKNWGAAVAYTYSNFNAGILTGALPTDFNSVGVSGYWSPLEASWAPSISAGFGFSADGDPFASANDDAWTWMVGLQWADAFIKGNALGMAIGSAGQAGPAAGSIPTGSFWTQNGENTLAYELWYKFQVTDNISVTPAFFWVQNNVGFDDNYGGLVKTTFKF